MLKITDKIIGLKFKLLGIDNKTEFTCIGYGKGTDSLNLIVGTYYDTQADRTRIDTFKFKEVSFLGNPLVF